MDGFSFSLSIVWGFAWLVLEARALLSNEHVLMQFQGLFLGTYVKNWTMIVVEPWQ